MAQYNAYPFQQKAIDEMLESFKLLWEKNTKTAELTLKSPTGSGKTFMVTHFINTLAQQPDWKEDVAYVWITFSDELAMQSKKKFEEYFFPTLLNQLVTISDFSQGVLKKNDILFLNWQKLVSKKAEDRVLRRPDENTLLKESGFYFEDVVEKTQAEGRQIIMIIDESHKNVTESAYRDVITPLHPRIIVKVSATPEKEPSISDVRNYKAGWVEVVKQDVIDAGLIKKEIVSQTEDDLKKFDGEDLDKLMLDLAIEKREQLLQDWKTYGADINPLILIQLPDDDKDAEARGVEKKETFVKKYLKEQGVEDNQIATWLSKDKTPNLANITENTSKVNFLLFKYAVGTGWDCPRAHILVMFREIKSNTFRVQTLGRILRMPIVDDKLADFPALQVGYLYTNYTRNEVNVIPDTEENKPKTQIVKMDVLQRTQMALNTYTSNLVGTISTKISDTTQKETISKAIKNANEKISKLGKELVEKLQTKQLSVVSGDSEMEYGNKTEQESNDLEKINKTLDECNKITEGVKKELEILPQAERESIEGVINSELKIFQDVMRDKRIASFVLDPALKTEFISRTNYGDLGKSSEFQTSFVESMNKWFEIPENVLVGDEYLIKKGIDITTVLGREIMVNAHFHTIDVSNSSTETTTYEMSENDVENEFTYYCYQIIKEQDDADAIIGNAVRSWSVLKTSLRYWFEKYALQNHASTGFYKVFLKDIYKNADSKFRPAITQSIKEYIPKLKKQLEEKRKRAEEENPRVFVVNTESVCASDYELYPTKLSLVACYLPKQYNGRDNETKFIDFLEQQETFIDWWLKNGTGKDDLGFRYYDTNQQTKRLFYPDWIIKFKDGRIGIFDTKGGITAKSQETKDKAECLAQHIETLNKESKLCKYVGGIIEMKNAIWYYNDSLEYKYEDKKEWHLLTDLCK